MLAGTRPARQVLTLALVALAYWAAARLSLSLALVHGQVSPVWPPAGIALVALLLFGWRAAPAILVAAFAVNLPLGPSPLGAAVIAFGDTLAPLLAAILLKRIGFRPELDRLRDAVVLTLVGALLGMAVSATVGTSVLVYSGAIDTGAFWPTWTVWWTGDAMGILLVAPFLLSFLPRRAQPPPRLRRSVELAGLLLGTGFFTMVLFQNHMRLEYLVLPLVMISAWRFRLRGAAPAALIASSVAIWAAVHGAGPFGQQSLVQKMITLQAFNVSVALASFVLAAFADTRQRDEELARQFLSAQAASEAKSAFLSLAAHELRTPITVIKGYLSILRDGTLGGPPEAWQSPLAILGQKTDELGRLVNQLLDASRVDGGAVATVRRRIDLRDVVEDAAERARPRASLLGAEIAIAPEAGPIIVSADTEQLGQVLDNLVNNALTYTVRPPRISITVVESGRSGLVRVEDNGTGIPEDELERVFHQFHRGSNPAFSNTPGTGLGLYIARQLVHAHGGTLEVERSEPAVGTVFRLALPLAERHNRPGDGGARPGAQAPVTAAR